MPHQRKIFYVPGLISLLVLYPMFIYQLDRCKLLERYYTIEIVWFVPDEQKPWQDLAGLNARMRNVTTIILTGDQERDSKNLSRAKDLIKSVATHKSRRTIRFHFKDHAKYGSFVEIINWCDREPALLYALYQNDCLVFARAEKLD